MGVKSTWSLLDIPSSARDAAQTAASREGLSVGEWLNRRILRQFSELNFHERTELFTELREHVAELAERLEQFQIDRARSPCAKRSKSCIKAWRG